MNDLTALVHEVRYLGFAVGCFIPLFVWIGVSLHRIAWALERRP